MLYQHVGQHNGHKPIAIRGGTLQKYHDSNLGASATMFSSTTMVLIRAGGQQRGTRAKKGRSEGGAENRPGSSAARTSAFYNRQRRDNGQYHAKLCACFFKEREHASCV